MAGAEPLGPDEAVATSSVTLSARSSSGVQSVERTFALLQLLADAGGSQGLTQLSVKSGLPQTTIHRLMATLVNQGYARHESSRRYTLGPRLIGLGTAAARMLGTSATSHLTELVTLTGETANLAVLEGDSVVYLGQVPGKHSMRMFTEPGRRVEAHCTAVGKAMLATLPTEQVREIVRRAGLRGHTPTTITDVEVLLAHLAQIHRQGFAIDEGEQEVGVRCVAVAVPDSPSPVAISISGPQYRIHDDTIAKMVPALQRVARQMSRDFNEYD